MAIKFLLSIFFLLSICTKSIAQKWADDRCSTSNGRRQIILEALEEIDDYFLPEIPVAGWLHYTGIIHDFGMLANFNNYSIGVENEFCQLYKAKEILFDRWMRESISDVNVNCSEGADACFVIISREAFSCIMDGELEWYRGHTLQEIEYIKENKQCTTIVGERDNQGNIITFKLYYPYININENVFKRGFFNLDPDGLILTIEDWQSTWNLDNFSTHYRYATDIKEAVEFLLLHEYAHACGMVESHAENFALATLVKLRRAKRNNTPLKVDFDHEFLSRLEEWGRFGGVEYSYVHHGSTPNRLPPGCVWK